MEIAGAWYVAFIFAPASCHAAFGGEKNNDLNNLHSGRQYDYSFAVWSLFQPNVLKHSPAQA
jgi:hypothetical protein